MANPFEAVFRWFKPLKPHERGARLLKRIVQEKARTKCREAVVSESAYQDILAAMRYQERFIFDPLEVNGILILPTSVKLGDDIL